MMYPELRNSPSEHSGVTLQEWNQVNCISNLQILQSKLSPGYHKLLSLEASSNPQSSLQEYLSRLTYAYLE